jgi:hypothetical protein
VLLLESLILRNKNVGSCSGKRSDCESELDLSDDDVSGEGQ